MNDEMVKQSEKKPIRREKGLYLKGNPPGPGRPAGILNKYSAIKTELLDIWRKGNGKEFLLSMLRGSKSDAKWATDRILSILPRQHIIDMDIEVGPKVVVNIIDRSNDREVVDVDVNNTPQDKSNIDDANYTEEEPFNDR